MMKNPEKETGIEKEQPASFWILPENRRRLKALSEQTGTSVSYLVNRALTRALENPESLFLASSHTDHTSTSEDNGIALETSDEKRARRFADVVKIGVEENADDDFHEFPPPEG